MLDASLSLPTVVFTAIAAITALLWVVSLTGVFDGDGVDEALDGALEPLGLAEVPALVLLSMISIVGWAVSVLAHVYILDAIDGSTLAIGSVLVALVAFLAALLISALIGPRIGRLMAVETTFRAADLVGRTAEIRSSIVTTGAGYADARLVDGTTSRVSVRTRADRDDATGFANGDVVMLVHYDADGDHYLVDTLPPELAT